MNAPASGASGIYTITNSVTGARYIGSSKNMRNRLNEHKRNLHRNSHFNIKLQNAFRKYGAEVFVFSPLIRCAESDLILFEQRAIDGFDSCNSGYNIRPKAESQRGHKFGACPQERREKIAAGNRGVRKPTLVGNKHTLGLKHSAETKAKMRIAHIGKAFSEDRCANISASLRGLKKPSLLGNQNAANAPSKSEKWKAAMAKRKGCKMLPFTAEHRAKLSIAAKARCARKQLASGMDAQSSSTTGMVETQFNHSTTLERK